MNARRPHERRGYFSSVNQWCSWLLTQFPSLQLFMWGRNAHSIAVIRFTILFLTIWWYDCRPKIEYEIALWTSLNLLSVSTWRHRGHYAPPNKQTVDMLLCETNSLRIEPDFCSKFIVLFSWTRMADSWIWKLSLVILHILPLSSRSIAHLQYKAWRCHRLRFLNGKFSFRVMWFTCLW